MTDLSDLGLPLEKDDSIPALAISIRYDDSGAIGFIYDPKNQHIYAELSEKSYRHFPDNAVSLENTQTIARFLGYTLIIDEVHTESERADNEPI